jgi:DUF917 family protein
MSSPGGAAPTVLDRQALEDIVNGSCILGSGGGGPIGLGMQLADYLASQPAGVALVEPGQVPDTAQMAISAAFGSPDAASGIKPSDLARVAVQAYQTLEHTIGTSFTHVVLGEIGAGNALVPMLVAQALGLPVVDAAGAPRAMPLFGNCVLADPAAGTPISPIAFSNGSDAFTATAPTAGLADPLLRGIVSEPELFPELGGIAFWSLDGAKMRAHLLGGALRRAWSLGTTLRLAPAGRKVEAVRSALGGELLYVGNHIAATESTGGGFDMITVTLDGLDGKSQLVVHGQNESLIAWRSDQAQPLAMAPDLICWLTEDGRPFSNAQGDVATVGASTSVAVIGVSAASLGYGSPYVVGSFRPLLAAMGYPGPQLALPTGEARA